MYGFCDHSHNKKDKTTFAIVHRACTIIMRKIKSINMPSSIDRAFIMLLTSLTEPYVVPLLCDPYV